MSDCPCHYDDEYENEIMEIECTTCGQTFEGKWYRAVCGPCRRKAEAIKFTTNNTTGKP